MNTEYLKQAVLDYFTSEAAEMICILIEGGALVTLAVVLYWKFNDRFSTSLAIVLFVLAGIFIAMSVSLLIRDGGTQTMLLETLDKELSEDSEKTVLAEKSRMKTVVGKYSNFRYMFAGIAFVGVSMIIVSVNGTVQAIAVGCLLFALSGVVIDQYSEPRARTYLQSLAIGSGTTD